MMLTGRPASAERALADGLVDRLAAPDALVEEACKLALHPVTRPFAHRALAWFTNCWPARQILAPIIRRQAAAKAPPKHYPAPFALIEAWRRGGGDIHQRLKLEARSVAKLAATPTAHNLIRIFFLRERLRGLAGDTPHGIRHVHVVGAGVMGGDIAAWGALRGFEVTLQDREMKFIEPALARARKLFEKKMKSRDRIAPVEARLTPDIDGAGIASSQLAIEAIYENPEAKEAVYRALEPKIATDALIATNTSSIPLDALRAAVAEPRRFLGLHFFNPVAQMPLVEVVRHDALDPTLEKRAWAWVKAVGKLPLPVKGTPGFLVNRILMPYLLEAVRCHAEGIPDPVIDRAGKHFGMPMGPIELIDTVGLDVALSVGRELGPFLGLELPDGIADKVEGGKRGKKDGQGFYAWKDGRPEKPKVDAGYHAPADLEDRLILPMLNEAVACLQDGVVADADLLDAGVIFGTGFAPFRGGPIQYIRTIGAGTLRERLDALAHTHGARFAPKQGWFNPRWRPKPVSRNPWKSYRQLQSRRQPRPLPRPMRPAKPRTADDSLIAALCGTATSTRLWDGNAKLRRPTLTGGNRLVAALDGCPEAVLGSLHHIRSSGTPSLFAGDEGSTSSATASGAMACTSSAMSRTTINARPLCITTPKSPALICGSCSGVT